MKTLERKCCSGNSTSSFLIYSDLLYVLKSFSICLIRAIMQRSGAVSRHVFARGGSGHNYIGKLRATFSPDMHLSTKRAPIITSSFPCPHHHPVYLVIESTAKWKPADILPEPSSCNYLIVCLRNFGYRLMCCLVWCSLRQVSLFVPTGPTRVRTASACVGTNKTLGNDMNNARTCMCCF